MLLMEDMIVGRLSPQDQAVVDERMEKLSRETEDPYAHEPKRSPSLIVHTDQPMNAETPAKYLTESYLTPTDIFYIRHHHPVPLILHKDLENFNLEIDVSSFVEGGKVSLTLDQIKALPKVEFDATLQCSGNRRGDMNKYQRTSGTSWGQGAVSTASWGGARLLDVLKLAGLDDPFTIANRNGTEKHVCFESLDGMHASIGMEKATNPYGDVILAYEMNGKPITRDHGFPLRVIVPGYAAVRNVKWLKKIRLSETESEGAWQRGLNYKTLPPNVTDANAVNLNAMPSMTESSVFSGITTMELVNHAVTYKPGETVVVKAKGWAWAGGGRNIVRVDITSDGGVSWASAKITDGKDQKFGRAWAWVFWECELKALVNEEGKIKLASKAVDMAFNSQPDNICGLWNVRGLGNNSWYKVERAL
jgi:sulfite oxidase